jgi:flagellar motor switch protein FliN/FliY
LDQDLIRSIPVTLTVELGSAKLKLKDLLRLAQGSVLELDTAAGEMLDLKVNGTVIAKGEVVTVGDQLGLTVVEIVSPMERIKPV